MNRRRIVAIVVVTGALFAAVAGSAGPARAAYPGADGRLAFGMTAADGNNDVFTGLAAGSLTLRVGQRRHD